MIDKKMMRNDPMDDKLTLYRQQVSTLFKKKKKKGFPQLLACCTH